MATCNCPNDLLDDVLIGGNHLASLLIQLTGGINPQTFPNHTESVETAQLSLTPNVFDIWVAWRAIMRLGHYLDEQGRMPLVRR